MSLITVAVIGKDNNPLYLRDFVDNDSPYSYSPAQDALSSMSDEDDPFGFFTESSSTKNSDQHYMNDSSSLKNQFLIHSALDRLEEMEDDSAAGMGSTRSGEAKRSSVGPNSMWIGSLGCFDETKVYGYSTSTKIKFLASVVDIENVKDHHVREAGLKALFTNVHDYYVEYTLNPFSQIKAQKKISSRRFDDGVDELVRNFNETFGSKGLSWL
mmetsp:Transcript_19838/g.28962  ORF Transcript_19838/g.28962 Transcript_19838/m.28962 type:complete len:213 (-) Transcript_19838:226-864(-)